MNMIFDRGKAALTTALTSVGVGWLATEQIFAILASAVAILASSYMIWYYKNKNRREKEIHDLKVENLKDKKNDGKGKDSDSEV